MSHCRKCGDAGDDALFTVSLPAGVEEDRRLVAHWAADCAERVLALFEAKAPSDTRPREAIEGARAFALDGKRTDHLRSLGWAAHAAAREVGDPVATAAARAATYAAATPYTHASRTSTRAVAHSLNRAASTQPAEPAPTTMKSYPVLVTGSAITCSLRHPNVYAAVVVTETGRCALM